jgi:Mg-chelatase subunit ChlD
VVNIEPEEKPKTDAVSYILEAAPIKTEAEKKTEEKSAGGVNKDISIVFCVDVSGSMAGSRM